jgi:Rrf2 family protein
MIKIYSKSCEHLLRIFSQIPQKTSDQAFLAKTICRKAKVSESSARKGLQLLVSKGILKAVSGPGGGYQFFVHPKKIPLLDVIEALDGKESYLKCVMGMPQCDQNNPCPMHDTWKDLRQRLSKEFKTTSVFDLMKDK